MRAVAAAGLVALCLGACRGETGPGEPAPRLVVLYVTCTVNRDYLAPYNPGVSFTPHLERFARQALVFARHQTEAGQSGTAFASIFAGAQADHHGVFRHPSRLGPEVELIGETFARAGWEVHAWLEHGMASGELGYAQGAAPENLHAALPRAEDPALIAVLERLVRDPSYRALILTSFTVTHGPYQPAAVEPFCARYPAECEARADREAFRRYADFYRRAHAFLSYDFPRTAERVGLNPGRQEKLVAVVDLLYRANVAHLDHLFGGLVEEIRRRGLLAESVVVFTADHGETLFRAGTWFKWTHGGQLAPEVLAVPLLIRAPGVGAGRYEAVTRSMDLFPTLAALARLPVPPAGEGRGVNLAAALRGEEPPPVLRAFSHTCLIAEPIVAASRRWELFRTLYPRVDPELMWVRVRDGDRVHMLRRNLTGELEAAAYDLAHDPHQRRNLHDPADPEQGRVFADLERYRQRLIQAWRERGDAQSRLTPEREEELLRSLGYVDGP